MKLHANHRTCPSSRRLICRRVLEEGWTLQQAAEAAGCSVRTAAKWVARFRGGDRELLDRSSRPCRSPSRLPAQRVQAEGAVLTGRLDVADALDRVDEHGLTLGDAMAEVGVDPAGPPDAPAGAAPFSLPSRATDSFTASVERPSELKPDARAIKSEG